MKISADELEPLFDVLPDVVFFVKDMEGRYTHANFTLVRRLGLKQRSDVIGREVTELFPSAMGGSYRDGEPSLAEAVDGSGTTTTAAPVAAVVTRHRQSRRP